MPFTLPRLGVATPRPSRCQQRLALAARDDAAVAARNSPVHVGDFTSYAITRRDAPLRRATLGV